MSRSIRGLQRDAAFDAAAAVAIAVAVFVVHGPIHALEPLGGVTVAGQAVLALALLLRRRAPLAVAWLAVLGAAAIAVTDAVAPTELVPARLIPEAMPWIPAAAPFAAYAAIAYGADRRLKWLPVAALLVLGSHGWDAPAGSPWFFQALIYIGGPALLALYVSARRRELRSAVDRAERAEREQHLVAERARTEERARLAAEMHDVVTHRLSLMVLHAGALRTSTRDPQTRAAAEDLRATGYQALEELRDVVGLLRDPAADDEDWTTAQRAHLPDLAALAADSRSVGVPVDLTEEGDRTVLSPLVGRTVHRIVQEALTNVRKHAPGATARVCVRYGTDKVHLSIRNTAGAAGDPALTGTGSRTGLASLRRRVDLVGGILDAAPDRDGGFRVEATLPTFVAA